MWIIGLDVHSSSFTAAVLTPQGNLAQVWQRDTTETHLREVVETVRGPRAAVVEECHLAQWVKRVLTRFVDRLVICDPRRNQWIAKDEFNDDKSSAEKLARLFHGGFIKEIRHVSDEGAVLRSLFLHYHELNQQVTRFKNKLKAVFRQEAITTKSNSLYKEEKHEDWLAKLGALPHLRHEAGHLFATADQLARQKQETHGEMVQRAKRLPAYAWLDGMPGAGPVVTTGYLALLETPHRFSRKNKLWKYGGYGNVRQTSDGEVYVDRASQSGNKVLKWVVTEHFQGAVLRTKKPNRFQRQYAALRAKGLAEDGARRQVCRALLSTVRALWLKEEEYRELPLS